MNPERAFTVARLASYYLDGVTFTEQQLEHLPTSRAHLYRMASHYRLFNVALGYGSEIYKIPQNHLDSLRKQIDWDHRERRVRRGQGGKLNADQARKKINQLLQARA